MATTKKSIKEQIKNIDSALSYINKQSIRLIKEILTSSKKKSINLVVDDQPLISHGGTCFAVDKVTKKEVTGMDNDGVRYKVPLDEIQTDDLCAILFIIAM